MVNPFLKESGTYPVTKMALSKAVSSLLKMSPA